jgi:hypothetical protein
MKTNYMMLLMMHCAQLFHGDGHTSIVWVMFLPVAVSVDSLCPDIPGWEVTFKHPFDVIVEVSNSCILFFLGFGNMLFCFPYTYCAVLYSLSLKKFGMAL